MTTFKQARAQCIRALDIIDTTQLDIFLQREVRQREEVVQQIDALESMPLDDAVTQMQQLLSEVLSLYNDPFANYINPKQHKSYNERRSGGFVGLGLKFRAQTDAYPFVIGALLGGPLEQQNMQPGDRMISVNDTDLKAKSTREISTVLKGEAGSTVTLGLERDGQAIKFEATRQAVQLHYARSDVIGSDIGYIKISRFGGKTHERVKPLLIDLLERGVKALVIDVRDNPGGSTRAARNIMSMFDQAAWVYCEQYKTGAVKRLPREGDVVTDLPVAVLVNEYSMSSSEILAGALQDYQRATLVGAPTFGKGLIQKVFALAEPVGGAVRTTIAMYGTPSHRLLHGRGLVPDVYVPSAPERLFKETGSVNISDEARAFRRSLLIADLREKYTDAEADAYSNLADAQLDVALTMLREKLNGLNETPTREEIRKKHFNDNLID